MSAKLVFEEAVRSANRVAARRNLFNDKYCVIKSAIQKPLEELFSHLSERSFYKIFQRRAVFNWEFADGHFKSLSFSPLDERNTTQAACRSVNSILDSLDYEYLAATSDDGSIENFNIYSKNTHKEKQILTSARIDIDWSELSAIKF